MIESILSLEVKGLGQDGEALHRKEENSEAILDYKS